MQLKGNSIMSALVNNERFSYSPSPASSDLAFTTSDGRLVVYDSAIATIKSEFVPTSHLSAACACIAWKPIAKDSEGVVNGENGVKSPKKARKRKNSTSQLNGSFTSDSSSVSDVIAIGTAAGSIVLYSIKTGEVKSSQETAHSAQINDICWTSSARAVYTCSSDGHVGRLTIKKSVFSKFKPDGGGSKKLKLFSLALHPSESSLLVGSMAKFLWVDLDTQTTLRTFSGHQGDVTALRILLTRSEKLPPFVVSCGGGDKDQLLSVWQLKADGDDEAAAPVAMLNANDTVASVCVGGRGREDGGDGCALVGAVTKAGVMHCFEFDANSKRKKGKPTRPKVSIQLATEKTSPGDKVMPIPILAGKISDSADCQVHLVHGSHAKPVFETHDYDKLNKITCLVRKVDTEPPKQQLGTKIMVADTSKVSVLTPGASAMPKTSKRKSSASGSREEVVEELPMLDRLRLLTRDTNQVTTPPRTDSLLQLLLQGLHNKDKKILNSVLDRSDEEVIDKTVRKLPVEGVIPLIEELQSYIKGRGMVNSSHSKWLRSVLQHHTSYLMSSPNCEQLLGPVVGMMRARTMHYAPLMQLKGKLDLMTKQIRAKPEEGEEGTSMDTSKEALLVYQDDSSEELSDMFDELLPPTSDTEETWNMDEKDSDDDEEDNDEEEEEGDEDSEMDDSD